MKITPTEKKNQNTHKVAARQQTAVYYYHASACFCAKSVRFLQHKLRYNHSDTHTQTLLRRIKRRATGAKILSGLTALLTLM